MGVQLTGSIDKIGIDSLIKQVNVKVNICNIDYTCTYRWADGIEGMGEGNIQIKDIVYK